MASQNFAEFLGSLHHLTDITLEEVEDCFNGAGFTDEYCEAIMADFKGKSEDEETLEEKLRIFNTRLRNVFNINSNIALVNEGT
mgnify:CR=1 FL=1